MKFPWHLLSPLLSIVDAFVGGMVGFLVFAGIIGFFLWISGDVAFAALYAGVVFAAYETWEQWKQWRDPNA